MAPRCQVNWWAAEIFWKSSQIGSKWLFSEGFLLGPHGVSKESKDLKLVFMFHDSCKMKILQGDVSKIRKNLRLLHEKNNETAVVTAIDLWLGETPSGVVNFATRGWVLHCESVPDSMRWYLVLGGGSALSLGILVVLVKGGENTIPPLCLFGKCFSRSHRFGIHPSSI